MTSKDRHHSPTFLRLLAVCAALWLIAGLIDVSPSGAVIRLPTTSPNRGHLSGAILHLPLVYNQKPSPGKLVINEVMPIVAASGGEWVELHNMGQSPIGLDGHQLTDEDGNTYILPAGLPDMPPDTFVLIQFDGLGGSADDYDWGDDRVILHSPTGMVDIFEDAGDQCALYLGSERTADNIVDFVAWGNDPDEDDDIAELASQWVQDSYAAPTQESPGAIALGTGHSVARYPAYDCDASSCWVVQQPMAVTPGEANAAPAPIPLTPQDGETLFDEQIALGWYMVPDVQGYHLQIDDDEAFISPVVDVETTDPFYTATALPEGTYFWRVRTMIEDERGDWSSTASFEIHSLPEDAQGAGAMQEFATRDLGIQALNQHKDTPMLCLGGCHEHGNASWDAEHTAWNIHDNMYCTRASIAMAAAHFGGTLSQDYISYYAFGRDEPEGDLGHGIGLWPNDNITDNWAHGNILQWAMGGAAVTDIAPAALTFDQLKGFIDDGRPLVVVSRSGGSLHTTVIDGYTHLSVLTREWRIVHWVDPWTQSESRRLFNTGILRRVHVPARGSAARSDPDEDGDGIADTFDDSDGDGMVDLDERHRFHTAPNNDDTDDDCVLDKDDVRGYMFDLFGTFSKRRGDLGGGDDLRKELDANNDGGINSGRIDGDEDANRNGHTCDKNGRCEGGDTSNFNGWDDARAPAWCHTPTPSPTPTKTPVEPTETPEPSPTEGPTSTEEPTGTPTITGTATATGTCTTTPSPTPTNTPEAGFDDGCCEVPEGCISGYLSVEACVDQGGVWYPGQVCNTDTGRCEPKEPVLGCCEWWGYGTCESGLTEVECLDEWGGDRWMRGGECNMETGLCE